VVAHQNELIALQFGFKAAKEGCDVQMAIEKWYEATNRPKLTVN
jgi:hypothetical protein